MLHLCVFLIWFFCCFRSFEFFWLCCVVVSFVRCCFLHVCVQIFRVDFLATKRMQVWYHAHMIFHVIPFSFSYLFHRHNTEEKTQECTRYATCMPFNRKLLSRFREFRWICSHCAPKDWYQFFWYSAMYTLSKALIKFGTQFGVGENQQSTSKREGKKTKKKVTRNGLAVAYRDIIVMNEFVCVPFQGNENEPAIVQHENEEKEWEKKPNQKNHATFVWFDFAVWLSHHGLIFPFVAISPVFFLCVTISYFIFMLFWLTMHICS